MTAQQAISGYELNLEEYWQIIKRRRWVIVISALFMGVFSWLFTWINQPPPLYASSVLVKIEPTAMVTELLRGGAPPPLEDINTQLALIRSYTMAERVAKRLGLVPRKLSSDEIRNNPKYLKIILELKRDIKVKQVGESRVIRISTVALSPEFARNLAQATAEEFRAYNIEEKNKQLYNAKRFIQQQLVILGERLKQSEDALSAFREKYHLFAGAQGSKVLPKLVSSMEKEYRQDAERLNDLRFALSELKQLVAQGEWDYRAVSVPGKVSPYFDQLNKRLMAMALKHTQLSTHFTEAHPAIQELRSQARDILASMVNELEKQIEMTKKRMLDLQANIEAMERKYHGLPEQVLKLRRLEREVETNETLFNQLEKKYQEILIKEAAKVDQVSIIRPALLSNKRINPVRSARTAVAGFILGLVLGLIISLVLESIDSSAGTIEEVESFLDVPVIGFIPHLTHDEARALFSGIKGLATSGSELEREMRLITHFVPSSSIAESYRSLRTNLLYSRLKENRVLLVTSSTIKEGKSTVATNLAVVLAQQGGRVLLIDADLRKPMLYKLFGLQREPGLAEYLLGQLPWRRAVRRISDIMLGNFGVDQALMTPGLDQLDILTSGRPVTSASDLLSTPAMAELLAEAKKEYDMVILDAPPLLHTTDATVLAGKVDGVMLVYQVGAVARAVLRRMKIGIESVGGRLIGVVLNSVRGEVSSDYARYKLSRYQEAYGDTKQVGRVRRKWWRRLIHHPSRT